ncbi:pimeloyl-[acyl-carrier protein] methyl ester esterase [Thioalkalivibrio denitrificans]|uniref:Pimeloyl-[acyl-carrier protein] methyl ester esterase n=1 Tax=Thioalkalivibrio denitrificans TaxID=108003 RepID=A0A1V3NE74_9GAMM|nr:pimeloyl-ACP methyl ester esterase BioH [Thioalkalivibrio denitrificans]OOG23096.1 pimeloyl-[acyl-carrier protein] methyl ester esterase [Thioalkalivibrio denitrificans]
MRADRQPATLLCLHGWGLNGAVWKPLADELGDRARVCAPDLPGHGSRAAEGRLGGLDALADELAAELDPPVTVVGWSLGGLVALRLAERYRAQVSGVVLVAATPRFVQADDWPHAMAADVLAAFARDLSGDYRATLNRFLALQFLGLPERAAGLRDMKARCLQAPPHPLALAQGLDMLRETDLRAGFAALEQPVSVVLGAADTLVPAAVGDDLRRLRPETDIRVVQGAGHAPLLTHPRSLANVILEMPGARD